MAEESQGQQALHWGSLARQLEPSLRRACDDKLGEIRWFRADWQRGGASTGYSTFEFDDGPREVVVKLPVGPTEHRFAAALADTPAAIPRVVRHGAVLDGYDLAWLVMERIPGDPISVNIDKGAFQEMVDAVASFHKHALEQVGPPDSDADPTDWEALFARAREAVRDNDLPDQQRWNSSLKNAQKALPVMLARWKARSINTWCHGDLHPGNAMRRLEGSAWGEPGCLLFDLACVHPGHWIEDAVYLERLFWARPEMIKGVKIVSMLAKARRKLDLDTSDDYAEVANLRRVMIASCVPAFLQREGHPKYLAGALDVLERLLPLVTK